MIIFLETSGYDVNEVWYSFINLAKKNGFFKVQRNKGSKGQRFFF
jgi:hypothetical protein